MRARTAAVLVTLAMALAACGEEPAPPPAPSGPRAELEPAVAEALERARARSVAEPSAETVGHLARVLHAHRMFREAAETYARAAELPGGEGFENRYLAGICLEKRDPGAARQRLEEAIAVRADYAPLLLRAAALTERMVDPAAARELFQRAEAVTPTVQGKLGLARTWLADGQAERAFALLRTGGDGSRQWLEAFARACFATNREALAERAAAMAARAPAMAPVDDPVLARVLALGVSFTHHLARAQARLGAGDLGAALAEVERALAVRPAHVDALGLRARVLARLDRRAEAVDAFRRALEVRPRDAELLTGLGLQLEKLDRRDEAARAFSDAHDARPGYADARLGTARLLGRTDVEAARAVVVEVLRSDPTHTLAQRALADLLIGAGDFERGTRYLQEALGASGDALRARTALEKALAD